MPSKSQAQNRYWHAVEEGSVPGDKRVAEEFLAADHGRKIRDLPQHTRERGMHLRDRTKQRT